MTLKVVPKSFRPPSKKRPSRSKSRVLTWKQNINWQFIAFLQFLHFTMLSDNDNDENDQSSYYESSSDDDEMIHTTASRKEVRNTILFKFIWSSNVNNVLYSQTIKQESLCKKIQCSWCLKTNQVMSEMTAMMRKMGLIWIVICAVQSQDLYSRSSSSHQSSSG